MAFDERKAQRVVRFIEALCHTKGEFHGQPFHLLPWQEKIIRDVFGTVRDDDPTMRQYTTAYIEIPKKNGKSELGRGHRAQHAHQRRRVEGRGLFLRVRPSAGRHRV